MKSCGRIFFLLSVLILAFALSVSAYASDAQPYSVKSPNEDIVFNLFEVDSELHYSVTDIDGYLLVDSSPIEFVMDRVHYFSEDPIIASEVADKTDSYSHLGNFSSVDERYNLAKFTFDKEGYSYYLEAAVFDDGVAFRYVLPDMGVPAEKTTDHTVFTLTDDVRECWYGVNNTSCEGEITAHDPTVKSQDDIFLPITAVTSDGRYVSIMEADVSASIGGSTLRSRGNGVLRIEYVSTEKRTGDTVTPWRVINFADTLNDLVNNDNIYTLCASPDDKIYTDTDWIVPGRSVWSWGVTQGSPSVGQMKEYTEYAAKLGFEYNIIDDGWPRWDDYKAELKQLGELGDRLNVRQIVWCAVTEGTEGKNKVDTFEKVDAFVEMMKECRIDGAKADFWWKESEARTGVLQNYFLKKTAEAQLVVDLHGCCKNSGTDRTYPNELTREGVRGLEHIGASCRTRDNEKYSELLTAQLFTRYLSGHAEWTPTVDSAMEIASVICIDSPLMSIASDPADIYNSAAREFIKSIPTVWDRTVVLSSSEIGKRAVFAKESAGVWFVGGVYSSEAADARVELSEFLPEGVSFFADIWDDSNGKTVHTRKNVTSSDTLVLSGKTKGTGFAIRLSPIELSAYGGEIVGAVKISCADAGDEVLYTLDGSDPLTSETARVYTGAIRLKKSCTLTAAVKGKASFRCNFNLMTDGGETAEKLTSFDMWKRMVFPLGLLYGMRRK